MTDNSRPPDYPKSLTQTEMDKFIGQLDIMYIRLNEHIEYLSKHDKHESAAYWRTVDMRTKIWEAAEEFARRTIR